MRHMHWFRRTGRVSMRYFDDARKLVTFEKRCRCGMTQWKQRSEA